jgi:mannose-6-phosphate isomerase
VLTPGEALYVPDGVLHAYVQGAGIEIMAASDNVLRGGLTGKRIDVAELLAIVGQPAPALIVRPCDDGPGVAQWPVPTPDFTIRRIDASATSGAATVSGDGPRIALCLDGNVELATPTSRLQLGPGQSAFCTADAGRLTVSGQGSAFVAACHTQP